MDPKTKKFLKLGALASSVGLAMVLATVIGLAVGYYLDKWLGTSPWLTLIFLLLGIVAGFRNLYVLVKKIERIDKDN
ncbi:MAG: AtpZ/AtpI family protein [Pseudomonadota bacterium]